jgi:hypothetical protein
MKRYIEYSAMRPIEKQDEIIYPLLDCRYNQDNSCNRKERKCNEGIYIGDDRLLPQQIPSSYISCKNCKDAFRPCSLPIVRDIPSLSPKEAKIALQKFSHRIGGKTFKLSIHSNSTLTFEMIERQLDQWERTDGFVPNIVAVDYIDIMVPEKNFNDYRHSQDYLWKQARKLSQERNVLLLTATQTNQSSYFRGKKKDGDIPDSSKGVRRYHVSEDKRKLSHASAIIGLSQTPDDLKDSIIKVNVVINRHGRCNDEYCVRMAGCLFISRPYLFSY